MKRIDMKPRGVIFDLDGTLVDSNALHATAWVMALAGENFVVPLERVTLEIGKGGDKLVETLLGPDAGHRYGEALGAAQGKHFTTLARASGIALLPGARAVIEQLRARGIRTALCTSSTGLLLETIAQTAGFDFAAAVDSVVTKDDAASSKPAGDTVSAALKALGLFPGQCVMVGDTPFDARAAARAGVVGIGIDAGEHASEQRLRAGGVRASVRDPQALLDSFDDWVAKALPLEIEMDHATADRLMRLALDVAAEGLGKGEAPIGCVIANRTGRILARAHNEMNARQSKIAHAEIVAFERLAGVVPPDERDLIVVSTLEPCVMCTAASMEAATDTIIFGLPAPSDGGSERVTPPSSPESSAPRRIGRVLEEESRVLLKRFLATRPAPAQTAYVSKLLAET